MFKMIRLLKFKQRYIKFFKKARKCTIKKS